VCVAKMVNRTSIQQCLYQKLPQFLHISAGSNIYSIIWLITNTFRIDTVTSPNCSPRLLKSCNTQAVNLPKMQLNKTLPDLKIRNQAAFRPSIQVMKDLDSLDRLAESWDSLSAEFNSPMQDFIWITNECREKSCR
jgi:hypothetical protein